MQKVVRTMKWLKKHAERLWTLLLLLYAGLMLLYVVFGPSIRLISSLRFYLSLPFYIVIPGYGFMILFPRLNNLEKLIVSMVISVAFFAGIKALLKTFEMPTVFSEISILTGLTVILLFARLVKP